MFQNYCGFSTSRTAVYWKLPRQARKSAGAVRDQVDLNAHRKGDYSPPDLASAIFFVRIVESFEGQTSPEMALVIEDGPGKRWWLSNSIWLTETADPEDAQVRQSVYYRLFRVALRNLVWFCNPEFLLSVARFDKA